MDYAAPLVLSAPDLDKPSVATTRAVDFELAVIADYLAPPIRGGTNPFGAGFGGRVGLVASHFYLGITGAGYVGGTDVSLADHALLIGGEIGWGFDLHKSAHFRLVLRPIVNIGVAAVSHVDPALAQVTPDVVTTASGRTSSGGRPSDTIAVTNVYVRPKLALVFTHDWQLIALEGDALLVPGISYGGADPSTWLSYGVQLQVGARF